MKIPQKIFVALRYNNDLVRGYMAVADKEETKYCQKAKAAAIRNSGSSSKSMYITNEAKTGFRVIDYTHDGLLIEHPEGFSFFISPRNMYDLIRTCEIKNGDIDNKLYFDDKLLLISEVSEILSDTLDAEAKLKQRKELLKNMKFNDHFYHNSHECVFIGRRHFLLSASYSTGELNSSSKLYYIYKVLSTGKIEVEVSPLPALNKEIVNKPHFTGTEDEAVQEAIEYLSSASQRGRYSVNFAGVSKKPIKPQDVKTRFIECDLSELVLSSEIPRISVIKNDDGTFSYFKGFVYYNTQNTWRSYYSYADYNTIDSYDKKYYVTKQLKKENNYYTIVGLYSDDSTGSVRFTEKVQDLKITVGYLEYYV